NSDNLPNLPKDKKFGLVIFATGHLHNEAYKPEKSIRDLNAEALAYSYRINCIIPALLIKELSQSFKDHTKIIFLSAKVGSISDNQLGGWYAYRMSKTALNMMIKNLAIELKRKYKNIIVCGLHPGTVASRLSSPFTGSVQHEIFSPSQSADYLIEVIENLTIDHSGKIYDYHSNEISP
ncbi:MAG: SDR family oxidoreductase, partial [Proteobacteria bacterium]|nr:SDR family oxidoreductase [Pseudomonadota bacterium]